MTTTDIPVWLDAVERICRRFPATSADWRAMGQIAVLNAPSIIAAARQTPYDHLRGYMDRFWVFNPCVKGEHVNSEHKTISDVASCRVHHILRADNECDRHNHPWDAKSIVLDGWYTEERDGEYITHGPGAIIDIKHDTFHRITEVSEGGVWTLFFFGDYQHTWGFNTADGFVPFKEYFERNGGHANARERLTDEERATASANERGLAFLVDGKFVAAERVVIVSSDADTSPINELRRLKRECVELLAELRAAQGETSVTREFKRNYSTAPTSCKFAAGGAGCVHWCGDIQCASHNES